MAFIDFYCKANSVIFGVTFSKKLAEILANNIKT
jgi:hypothetical protein